MAQENIEQLISSMSPDEREPVHESDSAIPELFGREDEVFEWIISPEQFVDFWIVSIFLLVGTWQIITMFFLLVE